MKEGDIFILLFIEISIFRMSFLPIISFLLLISFCRISLHTNRSLSDCSPFFVKGISYPIPLTIWLAFTSLSPTFAQHLTPLLSSTTSLTNCTIQNQYAVPDLYPVSMALLSSPVKPAWWYATPKGIVAFKIWSTIPGQEEGVCWALFI